MFKATAGDIDMVSWLLGNTNIDINKISNLHDSSNFLMAAIQPDRNIPENIIDIIYLLIEYGIDVNITDRNGLTPLDYVVLLPRVYETQHRYKYSDRLIRILRDIPYIN